ncbi:MAG TPA: ATP-binding protein [Acidimicrobiales bacterium]|nr:ATP-binding protein [Acidimicrobiales bacterium]
MRSTRATLREAERAAADARRRADALEAEGRLLRSALEALPLGVAVCDGSGALIYHNRRVAEPGEARPSDVLVSSALSEVLAGVRSGGSQTRTLDLHGPPPRSFVVTSEPLVDGPVAGAVAVVEDVTERRQLDAVRRDFVANVSHELRTPIGALAVLAETLASESDPDTSRRLAGHILAETERMTRTIEDFLDLSRVEAQADQGHGPVSVGTVVTAAAARVAPAAGRHRVRVDVAEVPDDLVVLGNETQLVSAVANLLDNAVKYSEAGSSAEVEVRANGACADIVVRDHGVGIPARDLPRIFERFYRVDRARSRRTGGTGLGLAIVRHVATNHGGTVLVESREGEGSTFVLRLPAERP